MGVSSKLNEGKIYRFLQTALRLRRMQREMKKNGAYRMDAAMKMSRLEALFDAQLDSVLEDVDEVDTERVIQKMNDIGV